MAVFEVFKATPFWPVPGFEERTFERTEGDLIFASAISKREFVFCLFACLLLFRNEHILHGQIL